MAARLDIKEARALVANLAGLKRSIYWTDFLLSYGLGWLGFVIAVSSEASVFTQIVGYTAAGIGFYRALLFIHEIAHFRSQLGSFWVFWNVLCGVPMAMPSFLYYRSHYVHHNPRVYGTPGDGEYLSFQHKSRWHLVSYLISSFFVPVLLTFRFVVLFPLSIFIPALRKWLIQKASALVIDPDFVCEPPIGRTRIEWWLAESGVAIVWATLFTLTYLGVLPWKILFAWFVLSGIVSVVNSLRTLAAHRFANESQPMSLEEQYLDSVNLTSPKWAWLNSVVAPVGLRFHALHHLFPFIPYYSLAIAHQRLIEGLPLDSAYHVANEPNALTALHRLWKECGSQLVVRPVQLPS